MRSQPLCRASRTSRRRRDGRRVGEAGATTQRGSKLPKWWSSRRASRARVERVVWDGARMSTPGWTLARGVATAIATLVAVLAAVVSCGRVE